MDEMQEWELKHLDELDRRFLRNSSKVHDEAGYAAQMETNLNLARAAGSKVFDFIDQDLG